MNLLRMQPMGTSRMHSPGVRQGFKERRQQVPLVLGTLDLLVLRALQVNETSGMDIAHWINENSEGVFQVKSGSLFPSLRRLESRKFVLRTWTESKQRRRAKIYRLTR